MRTESDVVMSLNTDANGKYILPDVLLMEYVINELMKKGIINLATYEKALKEVQQNETNK